MKKVVVIFSVVLAFIFASVSAEATKVKVTAEDFPMKGWHKGYWIAGAGGMMQVDNDKHSITEREFNGMFDPAVGLAMGWDIADWIGPMLQLTYGWTTAEVGDPNNELGDTEYSSHPGVTFKRGTFPVEDGRQHALDFSIFTRATLPYFTRANWQPNMVKVIPYIKVGGTGHAVFNHSDTAENLAGAFGGGPAIGAGVELFIWKGFFFAVDFTESFIYHKEIKRSIETANAGTQDFIITPGGMHPHMLLVGLIGWHF